ncbi:hypothetical protein [Desulfosarcina cetonica]|uniref:hypothetical protein n=1 Tax=Desulfosarcina cetonica TaxID=90730 RepID=UPI0006D02FA1|nr:hypothetical protein [Desulfosarcina cetonica]
MKHRFYAITVLFVGLLSAQIVATAHVHIADGDLMQATETIARNGYLAVPNAGTTGHLDSWDIAMAGGAFFTLSIGAGLALMTLVATWLWDRIFRRRRYATIGGLMAWIFFFYQINNNGFNLAATTYLTVVPLVTGVAAILLLPDRTTLVSPAGVLWPVSAVVMLVLFWSPVLDANIFTNIRDHLLLPHTTGRRIVDVYYRYTLFPAGAFQSLSQKQLRTCVLDTTIDRSRIAPIEQTVRRHDWLPVTAGFPADLIIAENKTNEKLTLAYKHRRILAVSADTLLTQPGKTLSAYAERLDRNHMFRLAALVGLTIGFPLLIFSMTFCLLSALFHLGLNISVAQGIAALLCVILGITLAIPVYRSRAAMDTALDPAVALVAASTRYTRIAALRRACQQHLDISMAARQAGLSTSLDVAERYWLAKSLADAHHPQARVMLQTLARILPPLLFARPCGPWASAGIGRLSRTSSGGSTPTPAGTSKCTPTAP